jgi:predicted glycoside hydrolase/deacetylase ChbG (UPF0249 family)
MTARAELIVNADDFGRTREVCDGVSKAFLGGLLTSTTVVANSPAFEYAVGVAKGLPELAVGVHLALDEYPPLSKPGDIPTLVQPDGSFYPRGAAFLRIMRGKASQEQVAREWAAQIDKVRSAGIRISHIDGHGHCHVCPMLGDVISTLLSKFDIKAARLPAESVGHFSGSVLRYIEKLLLYTASLNTRRYWGTTATNDHFMGFSEAGRLTRRDIDGVLAGLRPGVTELVAHPSTSDRDVYGLSSYRWTQDLASLLTYTKQQAGEKYGVRFITYRDLPDRS